MVASMVVKMAEKKTVGLDKYWVASRVETMAVSMVASTAGMRAVMKVASTVHSMAASMVASMEWMMVDQLVHK